MTGKSVESLEKRFNSFLKKLNTSECIDQKFSEKELGSQKRADFLLWERKIILELKSLTTDTEYKVSDILHEYRSRPGFPQYYGRVPLQHILEKTAPELKKEIGARIIKVYTRQIHSLLEDADDQIKSTREIFGLYKSCGMVVILNENIGLFSPQLVFELVSHFFQKKKADRLRYQEIGYVWFISECHPMPSSNFKEELPMLLIEGPVAKCQENVVSYLDQLQIEWPKFIGSVLSRSPISSNYKEWNFVRRSENKS